MISIGQTPPPLFRVKKSILISRLYSNYENQKYQINCQTPDLGQGLEFDFTFAMEQKEQEQQEQEPHPNIQDGMVLEV